MSPLARVLQGFFTDKLITQLQVSGHTIAAYRDTCRLLLDLASTEARKQLCQLDITDRDARLVTAFLPAPSWLGRRDHVLLLTAVHTGLRVSEFTGLTVGDVNLGPAPHVRCHGKSRMIAQPR